MKMKKVSDHRPYVRPCLVWALLISLMSLAMAIIFPDDGIWELPWLLGSFLLLLGVGFGIGTVIDEFIHRAEWQREADDNEREDIKTRVFIASLPPDEDDQIANKTPDPSVAPAPQVQR